MVLYILTGYRVLGIICLNQLSGARHTHISYHDKDNFEAISVSQYTTKFKFIKLNCLLY